MLTRDISLDLHGNLFASFKIVLEHSLSLPSVSGQFMSAGVLEEKESTSESKLYPTTPGERRRGRKGERERKRGERD